MSTTKSKAKYKINILPDWCKGCNLCTDLCPKGILELGPNGKVRVTDAALCSGCKLCELTCPDFGIWIEEDE